MAQSTAHTRTHKAAEERETANHIPWVGHIGATRPTHRASSRGGTRRLLHRARPGCIRDHGKCHPEQWKQLVTGKPVHSTGGGRLPWREAPPLKPQGLGRRTVDSGEQYSLW